ncbi:Peptidyl-prolyl cis-trans isomerase (rotamase)-cyclophilin family [Paenimyroides ummariense]|uniref:peptidylprolyl isomerase n=1 Tax=Paenimyroides ummariense TaxID=913024 RepID=A0A1I5C1W8_9FLAO|nr:peptidylprolyl isomerase [Paenimyroides ummariense]SFN80842.1 Peptidyl-prolyl cis-trans isomerase (rotamase)-cyclophilin family [Paenimyroides ummariense]
MKKILALAVLTATLFTACKKEEETNLPEGLYAEITTNKGTITAQLEYEKAPLTVANFVSLAEGKNPFVEAKFKDKPFYDGLTFHRVIANFMIQGGDPSGTGEGGPGYKFADEFHADLKHDKPGILSMANAGPTTNGSQFFITHVATPHLDGMHSVFGHVIEGQEIVNTIAQGDKIETIKIIRSGDKAKAFDAAKVFKEKQEQANKVPNETKAVLEDAKTKATTTNSGLSYYIFEKGNGEKPKQGDKINVAYAGYFEDGRLFDTSLEDVATKYNVLNAQRKAANQYIPIPFEYGQKTGMIPGFIEGIEQLGIGDKAYIFIPSHLGYGEQGYPGAIPPNTNLIFELHISK